MLSKFNVKTVQVDCDLTQEDQVEALMNAAISELGEIHIAVNNAGVEQAFTNLVDQTVDTCDFVFDVNVKSLWLCMKHELRHMQEKGQGVIVNTSSMSDYFGSPGPVATAMVDEHFAEHPDQLEALMQAIPIARMADPNEIADAIL